MLCAIILLSTHFTLRAQSPAPPQIDTPLTVTQDYFFNAPLMVPYSSSEVGIFNNAEVEIFSSTEVTLLPGFTASTDSGCGEFVAGIRDCPVISIDAQVQHVSCYGKPDGRIQLNCFGGNEPYFFTWFPGNQITQIISGLSPGRYTALVADRNGCIASDTITILEPPLLTAQTTTSPSECNENSGSVSIVSTGGVGNYRYFWENDGYDQAERSELPAGLYEILVQDSNNCSVNARASVSDIDGPEISVEVLTGVSCHGYNDASARIILPSSHGPEPVFPCGTPHDRLAAGTHPVIQQDSNGCVTVVDIIITEPDPLTVEFEIALPECGQANGSVLAIPGGGTPPYSYDWDNALGDSLRSNLSSGVYALKVSDANGCSFEQKIYLPDTNTFSLNISATDVKCNKSEDGKIEAFPSGGTAPYTYRWFAGDFELDINNNRIELLSDGYYRLFVYDNNNCGSTDIVRINYPEDFDLRPVITNPSTESSNDGSISLVLGGATPPYNVSWSSGQAQMTIDNLGIGAYTYQITDQNNCIMEGSINLVDNSFLLAASPCLINPLQTFNYSGIISSCVGCNPQLRLNPVYNLETDFGANGNDNLSDQQSFEWASDFIRQNYCSTGAKLVIPPGTYIVGRQDQLPNTYLKGFSPLQFCGCENIVIEGLIDPVTGDKPVIKFDQCFKYGAFDPVTGLRYIRHRGAALGNVTDYKYAADPSYIIQLDNCKNFEFKNLDLDGNIHSFIIGGYFASDLAGINLPHGGFRIDNSTDINIENCDVHHFGQDGLLIRDIKKVVFGEEFSNMNIRLWNSTFNLNCRDGFHWNGGKGVIAGECEFNYNGYGPWGGTKIRGGLEMEVDGFGYNDISHGNFIKCDFNFNNTAGIISNGQQTIFNRYYHDFRFKNCNIVSGEDSYSTFLENKNVTFECCSITGQVMSAYDSYRSDQDKTRYLSCTFTEEAFDPHTASLRSFPYENNGDCSIGDIANASRMLRIEGGGKSRVLFDGCTFDAGRYTNFGHFFGRGLRNSDENITIRNSIFIKRNGDIRDPNIETEIYDNWNRELMKLISVIATGNNRTFIPHQDDNLCFCHENGGFAVWQTCWFFDACRIRETNSTLRGARATALIPGYCDYGPQGTGLQCLNFEPDGYTDASYTDPINLPCVLQYDNPIFTEPNINVYPPPWVEVPGAEVAPLFWLHPLQNACLSNLRQQNPRRQEEYVESLSVYPVPSTDYINVSGGTIGEKVYIYNPIGKLVQSEYILSEVHTLDIREIQAGVYYLFTEINGTATKIIKTDK